MESWYGRTSGAAPESWPPTPGEGHAHPRALAATKASARALKLSPSLLSLVINKDGKIFLNGKVESTAGIDSDLRDFLKDKKPADLEAIVAADQGISHGHVIQVIDTLRLLGVDRFAINTKRQDIE